MMNAIHFKALLPATCTQLLGILLLWILSENLSAQNFSGLLYQELKLIEQPAAFSGLLPGKVEKVEVIEDGPTRLVVYVHYTGFEENFSISGSVLKNGKKAHASIDAQKVALKNSPAELVFELNEKRDAYKLAELESAFLNISVIEKVGAGMEVIGDILESDLFNNGNTTSGNSGGWNYLFELPKRWKLTESKVSNRLKAKPIGTAGRLDMTRPNIIVPPAHNFSF